ncbi:uncharacterized protein HD556DRAFT_1311946 [Suillus plorans]|uniref:Uncharacterized protein n=1 Tax=Suillus plorans TaxID=116603 RepID=A0A9P7AFR4_9AGAM|nr:uncharacterized protein HD556DRAFT_1311946 [Suillus plorans]KAG1788527.1 hypothetical protein HD556DRAFT_1311946 [Suillus plorans]
MASSSNVAHNYLMDEPALFDSFIYDAIGLMPLSGSFVDADDIDFIGYLALGLGPTLYPLYCRMMLHDNLRTEISLYGYVSTSIVHRSAFETEQSKEVPVYVNFLQPVIEHLNLPPKSTRIGPDNRFYVVYDLIGAFNSTTIVHLARHPIGYYPWSDFTTFAATHDAHASGSSAIIPSSSTMVSSDITQAHSSNEAFMTDAHDDQHLINGGLTSIHMSQTAVSSPSTFYSWITYSANVMDNATTSAPKSQTDRKSTRNASARRKAKKKEKGKEKEKAKAKPEGGLKAVIEKAENWKVALAYLRVLLRVAVCLGEIDNPFVLNSQRRGDAIHNAWPQALLRANVSVHELEEVKSLDSKTVMSHEDVLALANPLLSEFMYDARRLAFGSLGHSHGGFNLDDLGAGILLIDVIHGLLQQFIRPKSNALPIRLNGFAWFLCQQIAKEIMWHIVFRTSTTHGIPLVLADLNPADFRNAPHPPCPTMSLLGSCCYSALLEKYSTLTNIPVELLLQYPTPILVYNQLCETAVDLIAEHNDEGHPTLMASLSDLCSINADDVYRLGRASNS